jgi:hypothetical protein
MDENSFDRKIQKQPGKGGKNQKHTNKSSKSTGTCLPCFQAAPAVDPLSTIDATLSRQRSLQNLESSMSDKAGLESNAPNVDRMSPASTTKRTLMENVNFESKERIRYMGWVFTNECPNFENHQMINYHQPMNSEVCTCFVSRCWDNVDENMMDQIFVQRLSISGCTEKWKGALCLEHYIRSMFEEMVDKADCIIPVSEEPIGKIKILAGKCGSESKVLLQWWLGNSIATAVDEAKQYSEQGVIIEVDRFRKFDNHYRLLRNLFITHKQLLENSGPDDYHLFELYPKGEPHSSFLARMTALERLHIQYKQSNEQRHKWDQKLEQTWFQKWNQENQEEPSSVNQGNVLPDVVNRGTSSKFESYAAQLTAADITEKAIPPAILLEIKRENEASDKYRDRLACQVHSGNTLVEVFPRRIWHLVRY